MKNLKTFEYYYDEMGKTYTDQEFEDLPVSAFKNNKTFYINELLEKYIPEIENIKKRLIDINNDIEIYGPLDEEIMDVIYSLDNVLKKWEGRPINKDAKKYNI